MPKGFRVYTDYKGAKNLLTAYRESRCQMTDEEKKAQEEAEAKAKADAENESEGEENEPEEEPLQTGIEEALKTEREKRIEAERKLEETRQKARERWEQKQKEQEENGISEDDAPITRDSVHAIIEEEREIIRKEMRTERAQEVARKIAENDSEAELILEVWKNRTLSGTLDEQLSEAKAIATFKRTQKVNDELKRALSAKDGTSYNSANAQRKPQGGSEPKLNATDKTVMAGYTWDSNKNTYKKSILNGKKFLYVSRDMKKRWTENA